jgi:hypothetical protein
MHTITFLLFLAGVAITIGVVRSRLANAAHPGGPNLAPARRRHIPRDGAPTRWSQAVARAGGHRRP